MTAAAIVAALALYATLRPDEFTPAGRLGTVPAETVPPEPSAPRPSIQMDPTVLEEAIRALPVRSDLAATAARDYRERARFPPWSRPLPDGVDPLLRDRQVIPGRSLPRGLLPMLEIAPDQATYVYPTPVRISATLRGAEGRSEPRTLWGEVLDSRGEIVAELDFHETGAAYSHVATVDVTADRGKLWRGAYRIAVRAETDQGEERFASSGFLYSIPGGDLTGRYRDTLIDGNLIVEAELETFAPARFHLEATLADSEGDPIAWAQTAGRFDEGVVWIPLTFYGLVFRESGRDGPYRLASVALTTVDGMPNQKSDLVAEAYVTQAYEAGDFDATPFDDPMLLRAAEQLEGH